MAINGAAAAGRASSGSGGPTFGVLVFDHPANGTVLLGCDRTGWLVYFMAPQATNSSYHINGPMVQRRRVASPSSASSSSSSFSYSSPFSVSAMVDYTGAAATLKVVEASMTNEVLADVDAPCSLPIFHDDERHP